MLLLQLNQLFRQNIPLCQSTSDSKAATTNAEPSCAKTIMAPGAKLVSSSATLINGYNAICLALFNGRVEGVRLAKAGVAQDSA